MNQDKIFFQSEGDQWFYRNKSSLNEQKLLADPVLKLLDTVEFVPTRVLEVGSSNGYRLHELHARYACDVTAVEPSQAAIEDGRSRFNDINFVHGTASQIPIEDDCGFDLVIVHFVFHWIDRSLLLRSAAEIDRMVKDGGYIIIGDFYPPYPQRVEYHHLPNENVWTYKSDYSSLFLAIAVLA